MKKFIFKTIRFSAFFALFFVLVNLIFLWIITTTSWDFINRIESLRFDDPDFDLLVVGASTSFDGFDTELITSAGIKSYNLAMGGTTVKTSIIQLNEYITKYKVKPEYVLLGLNSPLVKTFDEDGIHPIIEVTMDEHDFSLNDIPILKFRWLGFEFIKKLVSKNHRKAELTLGQLKFQKTISDTSNYRDQYLDIQEYEDSYWVGELVKFCSQEDLELIIIEMPGYKETQNLSNTGLHKISFRNGYKADLYNFNSRSFCAIFDEDKDWIGNSHLNENGAEKFTREIILLLEEKYYLQSIE